MFNLPNDRAKQRFQEAFLRIELAYEKVLSHSLYANLEQLAQQVAYTYERDGLQAALAMVSQYDAPIQRHLIQHLTQTFTRFADDAIGSINPNLVGSAQWTLAAQRYIRSHGASKVKQISDTTRQQLQQVIEEAMLNGHSVPEIQRRILATTGGQMAQRRARTIAQTEVHAAACAGSQAAVESLNRPYRKEWISNLQPGRTRPWHLAAHGQIVSSDEPFLLDGEHLRYPGDPLGSARNVINCRCVNAYLF
jgi:uncharacterized protein with gpF-like domain